jgi:Fur family zinc uptake transcriptional regulator
MSTSNFDSHDHSTCMSRALEAVETACETRKLNLTPIRRRVLEILLDQHRAVGAYDVLAVLSDEGQNAQPPVAYRALDFLVSHGFAHKIEGLNAYVACVSPGREHSPAFLICRSCDAVAEQDGAGSGAPLGAAAADAGFVIEHTTVEAQGLCPKCASSAA